MSLDVYVLAIPFTLQWTDTYCKNHCEYKNIAVYSYLITKNLSTSWTIMLYFWNLFDTKRVRKKWIFLNLFDAYNI